MTLASQRGVPRWPASVIVTTVPNLDHCQPSPNRHPKLCLLCHLQWQRAIATPVKQRPEQCFTEQCFTGEANCVFLLPGNKPRNKIPNNPETNGNQSLPPRSSQDPDQKAKTQHHTDVRLDVLVWAVAQLWLTTAGCYWLQGRQLQDEGKTQD
jgi:hypothetical protein